MEQLANWMIQCLKAPEDEAVIASVRQEVETFCQRFPVPGL
jgi:glycine/serine hydroxymethyltransferase